MDPPKLFRVELLFQTADRFAEEIAFLIVVDAHVVPFRLDAIHVLYVEEKDATAILDHESLQMTRSSLQLFKELEYVPIAFASLIQFDLVLDSVPGHIEPLMIERLEEVIEGMHLKGAHRILIVSGYEDDVRRCLRIERLKYFETTQLGHLDIQEDKVRP